MNELEGRLPHDWRHDDEPVGVVVVRQNEFPVVGEDDRWRYIPNAIWRRLIHLGEAYELHFAQICDPVVGATLQPPQAASLAVDLALLRSFIQDQALEAAVDVIAGEAEKLRAAADLRLVISPP